MPFLKTSVVTLLIMTNALTAVLIDQIAVTVANQAITQAEITREIRLAALLNGEQPDYGLESRRQAAARLLEQALVHREMAFGSYPAVAAAQVDQSLASVEKAHGGKAALDQSLAKDGISGEQLRSYLEWQIALLRFIDLRFRPSVQITREDVAKYYEANIANFPKVNGQAPTLRDVRALIEQKLTGDRVDQQVDQWLNDSRAHTTIRYVDSSLAPAAGATH